MPDRLAPYLARGVLLCTEATVWGHGKMPFAVGYYSSRETAPPEYVSSVRAIVFSGDSVLVVKAPMSYYYIFPGGRIEKGEKILETLSREMLEETGWTIRNPRMAGFMHFHNSGDRPEDYKYHYPDFIWPVYAAEAEEFFPEARVPDNYVQESGFQPLEKVKRLPLAKGQLLLLEAALEHMQDHSLHHRAG